MSADFRTIEEFKGRTFVLIENNGSEEIVFTCADGDQFQMYHSQECCESVSVQSVEGDLQKLIGEEISVAEERIGHDWPGAESATVTDYLLETKSHSCSIRWVGESNGWYSESVTLQKV